MGIPKNGLDSNLEPLCTSKYSSVSSIPSSPKSWGFKTCSTACSSAKWLPPPIVPRDAASKSVPATPADCKRKLPGYKILASAYDHIFAVTLRSVAFWCSKTAAFSRTFAGLNRAQNQFNLNFSGLSSTQNFSPPGLPIR